jgi:hypothetical protein
MAESESMWPRIMIENRHTSRPHWTRSRVDQLACNRASTSRRLETARIFTSSPASRARDRRRTNVNRFAISHSRDLLDYQHGWDGESARLCRHQHSRTATPANSRIASRACGRRRRREPTTLDFERANRSATGARAGVSWAPVPTARYDRRSLICPSLDHAQAGMPSPHATRSTSSRPNPLADRDDGGSVPERLQ